MLDLPAIAEEDPAEFDRVVEAARPAVFRGLVSGWPAVAAGDVSPEHLRSYLLRFDGGTPVEAYVAPPEVEGRFFYSANMDGFNFERGYMRLGEATALMLAERSNGRRNGVYVGAVPIAQVLPGFEQENELRLVRGKPAQARIWLGNETTVAAHWDSSNNLACVVAGRRRFTLFPPDQVSNLYVGPIDMTISGPPASMVDVRKPDFDKFPRFGEALANAMAIELEPGDAIYMPALWWHHVEALSPFNMLVNYWWEDSPPDAGAGMACIGHGLLTISHLPRPQREAWRQLFDHYVFRLDGDPAEHIPKHARGVLAETSPTLRQSIKQFLLRVLSQR
jgi:hypothetical protein